MDVFFPNPLPSGLGDVQKGRLKEFFKNQRQWVIPKKLSSRHSRADAHIGAMEAHTWPSQVRVRWCLSVDRKKRVHTTNQEGICN